MQSAITRQLGELLFAKAEAGHFRNAHTQSAGSREALLVRGRLIVHNDMILLQPPRYLRPDAIAHRNNHLMGLRIVHGRIAGHIQSLRFQALGKMLGIFHNRF